jgi:hypothetical protein
MTEAELRKKVVDLAHALGWRVFSLPIAKTRRPVKDATGYPDLTLARDRRILWIELKADDGVLSDEQMQWMHELPWMEVVRPNDYITGKVGRMLA